MEAPMPSSPIPWATEPMLAALAAQRNAYLEHPVPSLAERRGDLQQLARFIRENKQALLEAVAADYGHRSHHETLLSEVGPLLSGIRHTPVAPAQLDAATAPQSGPAD